MNQNQLKYFVAAAETSSFTKAAEQFYISQTAITQQIPPAWNPLWAVSSLIGAPDR